MNLLDDHHLAIGRCNDALRIGDGVALGVAKKLYNQNRKEPKDDIGNPSGPRRNDR